MINDAKNNRNKWIHVRLSPSEFELLEKKFRKTTCRGKSDFIRALIFEQPVVTTFRNQSQDEGILQLSILNRELNGIGNNFNQSVKKLHTLTQNDQVLSLITTQELQKNIIHNKIEEIKKAIRKMTEQWLR